MKEMKYWCAVVLLAAAGAAQFITSKEIKDRMKLISRVPSYANQNQTPKPQGKNSAYVDIEYSEPKLEGSYEANAKFNPMGMGHLYYVTQYFLDLIERDSSYPPDLFVVRNKEIRLNDPDGRWPAWLEFYAGIASVIIVGLVFALVMPIAGLLFCCCRCGGKCGARTKLEKQSDPCKRITIATLLSAVAVVILFGVVCSFVTNEYMKEGTEKLEESVKTNLNDAELYLRNTKSEVHNLLIDNFKQLEDALGSLLGKTGGIVKDQLASASHAVALTNLTAIVSGMEIIKEDLAGIQNSTRKLQESATILGEDLDLTRQELLNQLSQCRNEPTCRELLQNHNIVELKVVQNFSELPDIGQTFVTISRLLGDNNSIDSIQKKVLDGQKNFDNIKYEISRSVESSIPDVKRSIHATGVQLEEKEKKIKASIDEIQNLLNRLTGRSVDQGGDFIDEYAIYRLYQLINSILDLPNEVNKVIRTVDEVVEFIHEYGGYRYYLGLGVSASLLLILLCLTFGLLCGICGKRPEDIYSDDTDCCNTVAGSRFLMISVWFVFLLSSVLMVITIAHFVIGVALDTFLCKPLDNPSQNNVFYLVDRLADLNSIYGGKKVNLTVSEVIGSCHQNKSIYETLKLSNVVNIDDVLNSIQKNQLDTQIKEFKSRINVRTDRLELLTPDAKDKLRSLANSPLNDIQFDRYTELLNIQVTNINLTLLSQELLTHADKIPDHASSGFNLSKVKKVLRAKARFLDLLQKNIVAQIKGDIQLLKANVASLKEHLKFNHTSLRNAVEDLLNEVESAQLYLRKNGTAEMKLLVDSFADEFTDYVKQYLERVVKKTKEEIGRCGPLSTVYNSTKVAGCNRILDPFNGFWASVGWSLLLFIPAVILSVKLASLYSKSDAYGTPGMYGESEYLYDAYADRDNMPLAMVHRGDKKKNHHRNYQETYDNSGNSGYLQDYSAHLGRSERASASQETRYTDMAPKHWGDFSNSRSSGNSSGPPRYHHPPSTEYERPPPYYYPGPGKGYSGLRIAKMPPPGRGVETYMAC